MKEITTHTHQRQRRAARLRTYCRASIAIAAPAPADAPRNRILVGDAVEQLRRLPEHSVDTIVTSPPYHLLRRYGGGQGEIGTETHIEEYVDQIVAVCDELAGVLKPSGSLWLNLGDSFSRHRRYGATPKSMLLAPERILLALAARGWIVRSKVIWAKTNHLPSSVRDRLTLSWEPLYFLTRSPQYYFDLDAIRVPHRSRRGLRKTFNGRYAVAKPEWVGPLAGSNDGLMKAHAEGRVGHVLGKNPGDVWRLATAGFRGAHVAAFPEKLVERPILAACPERTCENCGQPWQRPAGIDGQALEPTCQCDAGWQPGVVLDPFMGSGTVGVVATRHGRDWLGVELNPVYAADATKRIAGTERPPP